MPASKATAYLFFNGTAHQAIALYEKALGARLEHKQLYSEVCGEGCPAADKSRIIHATLHFGEDLVMVSDAPESRPVPPRSNVAVALDFPDLADMTRAFNRLGEKGEVDHPLQDAFWGDKFGALMDEFGISWMFVCRSDKNRAKG